MGDIATGALKLESSVNRNLYIPLPPGEWRVVTDIRSRSSVENLPLRSLRLANVVDGKLKGTILARWNMETGSKMFWVIPKICSRPDLFFLTNK